VRGGLPSPALAAAAIAGGEAELDDLAKAWLPHGYAWCHRLGGPGVDAEDAAHEA
jgi:DNA-directed RNA polymerase specialized sigma24 family protein